MSYTQNNLYKPTINFTNVNLKANKRNRGPRVSRGVVKQT